MFVHYARCDKENLLIAVPLCVASCVPTPLSRVLIGPVTQVCRELDQVKNLQEDLEKLVEDTAANVKQLETKVSALE